MRNLPNVVILQLGDPRLRQVAAAVSALDDPEVLEQARRVYKALQGFRQQFGFGRATAAPQLGIQRRLIALHLRDWPSVIFNPEITWRSADSVTLWDDCMCFPMLLVRVSRAASISVRFYDRYGEIHHRERLDTPTSELLQHEIDHLDGILATDRALDKDSLVTRQAFEQQRDYFLERVSFNP